MSNNTLPFSHSDYDKLTHPVFPTIRRRDKYGDVGTINDVEVGDYGNREVIGQAEIIAKETVTLDDLSDELFMWDTDSESVSEATESINEFYQNPIEPDEELTMYWNKWVDQE